MSHGGRMGTCPICTGPAHHCDDGSIYCGEANITMDAERVEDCLRAIEIANRIKAGVPARRYTEVIHGGEPS